ncbi:hypothetical protein [Clostridium pasteurianum]|uniref:Uncharacterized protein n=1 Tax=Clostridium pasteurianum BC1 TaxID=86416 RepID=R4JXL9_CLOPA|nr:hypothetical protein [Clostridium pasteurianum]AGK95552.1 hypothetical protein Clopa_0500 [Clostridium pasteurianum BC1]
MIKKHIVWRILFMIFAAAISITGVWTDIKGMAMFGVILWVISTIINIIYSCQAIKAKSI